MVAFRSITILALAATGAIASPCAAPAGDAAATGAAAVAAPAAAVPGGACPAVTTNEGLGPKNVGVNGAQFVTGQCINDANCASACCVAVNGDGVCRNEPALAAGQACGFSCTPAAAA